MTGGTYWNSINAPSVTFCSRIIALLHLFKYLEVMDSCLGFFIYFILFFFGLKQMLYYTLTKAAVVPKNSNV